MPLVAQLTLPSDAPFFVRLGASGQRKDGAADWHEAELVWSHAVDGACAPGMTGAGCATDINECESNPCANEAVNYRARLRCHFVLPLIHVIPDWLTYSVPLFL
jgi:hypothetical protein